MGISWGVKCQPWTLQPLLLLNNTHRREPQKMSKSMKPNWKQSVLTILGVSFFYQSVFQKQFPSWQLNSIFLGHLACEISKLPNFLFLMLLIKPDHFIELKILKATYSNSGVKRAHKLDLIWVGRWAFL